MTARRSRLTAALAKMAQTAGMEVSDHVANNVKNYTENLVYIINLFIFAVRYRKTAQLRWTAETS
jgi:hypothetical protein